MTLRAMKSCSIQSWARKSDHTTRRESRVGTFPTSATKVFYHQPGVVMAIRLDLPAANTVPQKPSPKFLPHQISPLRRPRFHPPNPVNFCFNLNLRSHLPISSSQSHHHLPTADAANDLTSALPDCPTIRTPPSLVRLKSAHEISDKSFQVPEQDLLLYNRHLSLNPHLKN